MRTKTRRRRLHLCRRRRSCCVCWHVRRNAADDWTGLNCTDRWATRHLFSLLLSLSVIWKIVPVTRHCIRSQHSSAPKSDGCCDFAVPRRIHNMQTSTASIGQRNGDVSHTKLASCGVQTMFTHGSCSNTIASMTEHIHTQTLQNTEYTTYLTTALQNLWSRPICFMRANGPKKNLCIF